MSHNASKSNCTLRNKFGFTSTCASSEISTKQLLWSEMGWEKKKRDFINVPIYLYESLGNVEHIMVDKSIQLSIDTTTIKFTTKKPQWSMLYEEMYELDV